MSAVSSNDRWIDLARTTLASWRAMADRRTALQDVSAGLTVAMVAIPLNLALAVACGLPPHAGLVSGAVAGLISGLFSGSPRSITGPEVALAPLTLAIVDTHGVSGLVVATVLAGLLQIVFGLLRVGGIVRAIPRPVVGGFMAAVGLLVFDAQLPKLLGLDGVRLLSEIRDPAVLLGVDPASLLVGAIVVVTMVLLARAPKGIPAPLVALTLGVLVTAVLGLRIARVEPLGGESLLPTLPRLAGIDWVGILPSALALAALASMDSLLCAVSVDERTRERHPSDQELVAQGLANVGSGLLGGMPVAAAIVRSVVAVDAGATTRLAALVQALVLAVVAIVLGGYLDHLPLVALAGVLLVVGARLVKVGELRAIARVSRLEAGVFVVTALAILGVGFVPGVAIGVALTLATFAVSATRQLRISPEERPGARVLRASGTLFFGSQSRFRDALEGEKSDALPLVLDLGGVHLVDASGIATLRLVLDDLRDGGREVRLAGIPATLLEPLRAELEGVCAGVHVSLDDALAAFRGVEPSPAPARTPVPRHSIGTGWVISGGLEGDG